MQIDGRFQHRETKVWFYYREGQPEWAPDWFKTHGVTHTLLLENTGQARGAKILKTVAHILVDEGPDGPVWESWPIGKHYQEKNY